MASAVSAPGVPPSVTQLRYTAVFLLLLTVVEGSRSPVLAGGLLAVGLLVCDDYRRERSTLTLWVLLSVVTFGKVLIEPARWSTAMAFSLQLGAIAGAFMIGSGLKFVIARINIRFAASLLIAAGLAVSVIAPVHGFIFNRLLMIGALLLVSSGSRALSVSSVVVALVVAGLQFMQGSRASALLVVLVSAWYAGTSLFSRGQAGRVVVVSIFVVGALITTGATLSFGPLRQRIFVGGDVSRGLYLADRNKLAADAARALSKEASTLFFGIQPGTFHHVDALGLSYPYPHNIVLQLLMDFGVVLGALLLILIVSLFVRSLRHLDQRDVATRCCAVVALGLILLAMFNGTYLDYRFAALWLGAAIAPGGGPSSAATSVPITALAR